MYFTHLQIYITVLLKDRFSIRNHCDLKTDLSDNFEPFTTFLLEIFLHLKVLITKL